LAVLVGILGLAVSGLGLVLIGEADPVVVATIRGETVELHGQGLYEYDTLFQAANNQSTDLVTLLLGLPLLGASLYGSIKGSLRARLLLLGTFGYFFYVGASYALGAVAYNDLYLLYVAFFSASLFALVLTLASFRSLTNQLGDRLPRRLPGVFMWVSAALTIGVWLMDPIAAMIEGGPPTGLGPYSTLFTYAFDIGVIVPVAATAGAMILSGRSFGYVTAFALLVLEAFLMPIITLATIFQIRLGISFTLVEVIGPIAGFSILAVVAIRVIVVVLRRVPTPSGGTA
jgi:hypothetical protein